LEVFLDGRRIAVDDFVHARTKPQQKFVQVADRPAATNRDFVLGSGLGAFFADGNWRDATRIFVLEDPDLPSFRLPSGPRPGQLVLGKARKRWPVAGPCRDAFIFYEGYPASESRFSPGTRSLGRDGRAGASHPLTKTRWPAGIKHRVRDKGRALVMIRDHINTYRDRNPA